MNIVIHRMLAHSIGALAIGALGLYPVPVMARHSAVGTYRCAVAGESAQCHPSPAIPDVRIEKEVVLGPYAQYLVSRGESTRAAAARAQESGEPVIERTVRITKQRLGEARYTPGPWVDVSTPTTPTKRSRKPGSKRASSAIDDPERRVRLLVGT